MPSGLATPIYNNVLRLVGDPGDAQEVKRRRQQSMQTMRRMGVPVLVKHMYTIYDVNQGVAQTSQNQSSTYRQGRNDDPLSYGVGYNSVQTTAESGSPPQVRSSSARPIPVRELYQPPSIEASVRVT